MFLYRSPLTGKRTEMSLEPVTPENNITRAKTLALKYRVAVLEGRCPLAERQAEQSARKAQHATRTPSFHAAFDLYLAAHEGGWRNPKHRAQWSNSVVTYAFPVLKDLAVDRIGTAEVILVLEPIWRTKTETASRVRARVESVLDYAGARHWCQPASAGPGGRGSIRPGQQRACQRGSAASGRPGGRERAGGTQATADEVRALAAKLRAKRRPLPLTSTTLAGQIGVEPDELDAALHARPVPP